MALNAIYQQLDAALLGTLGSAYNGVSGLVGPPLQIAMAINLMVVSFATLRGLSQEPFGNYLATWLKCYLVILAATGPIMTDIAQTAQGFPNAVSAAAGLAINTSFDTFITNAIDPAQSIHNSMPLWNIPLGVTTLTFENPITLVVVFIITVIAYIIGVIALTLVLFLKFGLYVTVAVMPLFVAALIFPSSSGLFFSWLGAVLNYAVQTVAIALTLALVINVISTIPAGVGVTGNPTTILALEAMALQIAALIIGGFLLLLAQQVGSFAGGGGASGAAFLSAVYSPISRAARSVGGMSGRFGRGMILGRGASNSISQSAGAGVRSAAGAGARMVSRGVGRLTGASTRRTS
jgi:type IV secretion system protein VirB6